jgi:uncharacterized protein YdcH (DUF465 family)
MICIDNAVELMMKVYLGLPKRVSGLSISRKEQQEFSESFPALLDALEKHATDKLDGINLGDIEWYHRLRNELYHQGNGLTVERDKVEIYAELAKVLFNNLFGFRLVEAEPDESGLLGKFMEAWVALERAMMSKAEALQTKSAGHNRPLDAARLLRDQGLLSTQDVAEVDQHRSIRNRVVHGDADYKKVLREDMIARLWSLTKKLENSGMRGSPQTHSKRPERSAKIRRNTVMEMTNADSLKEQLLRSNPEFRELAREHGGYEARLNELAALSYPSDEQQLEEITLKKKKLALKDQMYSILLQYQKSQESSH